MKNIIELKYAPRKCKHFCCGDCSISGRTCMTDFPDCRAAEPKDAEKYNLEDYTKDNPELAKEVEKEMKRMTNYEKIKNMTVEEMAEFLIEECQMCPRTTYNDCINFCFEKKKEWLEREE